MKATALHRSRQLFILALGSLLVPFSLFAAAPPGLQTSSGEPFADGLRLTKKAPQTYLLTWDAYQANPCEDVVTYSVYRGDRDDFDLTPATLVLENSPLTRFLSHEPTTRDYYYQVTVQITPTTCTLRSGLIRVFPVDLGATFNVSAGTVSEVCTAQSTTEIHCPSLPQFHAAIAEQWGHEYLLGCESADYDDGAWNCVNLTTGSYRIEAHHTTVTVLDSGIVKVNLNTGKEVAPIVPVFSVLEVLK